MVPPPEASDSPAWPASKAVVEKAAQWMRRNTGSHLAYEDLVGIGREAMLLAERDYAVGYGVPFGAYARLRVRRAMIDAARREGRISGRDRAVLHAAELSDQVFEQLAIDDEQPRERQAWVNGSSAAATLAVVHAVDFGGNAAERLERAQLKRRADALLAKRPPPVKRLFELVYEEGLSLDAAARACAISPSWATRIHAREIALLARELHAASEPRATPGQA